MNRAWPCITYAFSAAIAAALCLAAPRAAAEAVHLTGALSKDDASCLSELLPAYYHYLGDHSNEIHILSRSAEVGRIALSRRAPKAYLFLFKNIGWCGSAGCLLMIGERRKDHRCHLLYVSDGSEHAIVALRRRDHGYRRLYTPCEARFDGKQYRQVHEECPTIDVQR